MQCANCGFENMPGISTCARCASSLALSDVSVVPPRASRVRAKTRVRRVWHPVWNALRRVRLGPPRSLVPSKPVSWSALAWTIVPGLGHLKIRRRISGVALLCVWLALLALTVLSLGLPFYPFLWMGAVAVHAAAFVSLFTASLAYERFVLRALFGVFVFAVVYGLFYMPIARVCSNLYVLLPAGRVGSNASVARGDVLLYEGAWRRPERFNRGDLVAYTVHQYQAGSYFLRAGMNVDRIIGTPGDHVEVIDEAVFVNGEPLAADRLPLSSFPLVNLELTVQPRHYLILPSNIVAAIPGNYLRNRVATQDLYMAISVVDEADILGRIVFRLHPWRRLGFVR